MKSIHYRPLPPDHREPPPVHTLPVEALAETIFGCTSLEEALETLRREGYRDPAGRALLPGIKDLLDQIRALRDEHAALSLFDQPPAAGDDGPVRSGASLNSDTSTPSVRFIPDSPAGRTPPSSRRIHDLPGDYRSQLDRLEKMVRRVYWGYEPGSVDEELLERLLGRKAREDWGTIRQMGTAFSHQGLVTQSGSALRLTPAALHKIGWNILKNIFRSAGREPLPRRAGSDLSTEPCLTGALRPYRFGDPPLIEPTRSLLNAIKGAGSKRPIRLHEQDFMVFEREPVSRFATVILLDLSRSMRFEDRYIAAKKVTLALQGLIERRYPRDRLAVAGFSTRASVIENSEIPFLTWDETNPYTNMEEALDLAHRLLSYQKGFRRQLFLITDGEPTAHREQGSIFFQFPPHPRTLRITLARLQAVSRSGVSVSIFLLSRETERVQFAHHLARSCGGKVFHIEPGDLGRCLLMDYLDKKSRWL